jgi:type I restriction enzyme S subunit
MNGKRRQRSADIPVRDSKPKRGLENPRSFPGAGQGAEGDSGETRGMSDWQTKRLGEVLQLNYGKSLPLKNRAEGDIPVFGSNGVVGSHNQPIVDKPGLVVGRKGSAGEVHFSRGPFCPIDTTFYVTEDDAPDTDLEFLFYLLRHVDLRRITGDVGVPGLNREMAYMEPVRLPRALPEQKKIAHILSTVQRAIEAQERIIQTTTELKKALMHKLFTEGLRHEPQKQTEIGPVPESWKVVPLKRVAEKPQYGLTAKAAKSGTTKFLRITDITDEGVNWSTVPYCSGAKKKIDACRLKSGDIVFARIGATTGKSYMITDPPDAVFASYLIRVRAGENLEPGFLIQFFQSNGYWQQVDANKHANLKKGVNGSILSEMFVPLPTLEAQKEIAAAFMATDHKVRTAAAKRDALKDLFRTLLHELMTAKTRVHELELSA